MCYYIYMNNIFIIHGIYGHPGENWFPWMKKELEKEGHKVFVPQFPTPENYSLESWSEKLNEYKDFINEETIFIGHSIAVAFLLSVLENLNSSIKACYFIASVYGKTGVEDCDRQNVSFVEKDFNWDEIRKNCKNFYLFHSDNDPYSTLESAQELAKNLHTDIHFVKGAGHFNEEAGYLKFPELCTLIKNQKV